MKSHKNHSLSQETLSKTIKENEKLKKENEALKKALGEAAVEKYILETANNILKKNQKLHQLNSQKKRPKK